MPLYIFSNPKDESEIVEVVMSVHDKHEFIKDGIRWDRIFTKPQAATDSRCDPFSSRDFVDKSRNKKGNLGNLFDEAKEMSLKRQDKLGIDPVKQKFYEDYKNKRKGKVEHPDVKKAKSRETLKKFGVTVTD